MAVAQVVTGYKYPNNMHGYSWNNIFHGFLVLWQKPFIHNWFFLRSLHFFCIFGFLRAKAKDKRNALDLLRALMRPLCIVLLKFLIQHTFFIAVFLFFLEFVYIFCFWRNFVWDLCLICNAGIKPIVLALWQKGSLFSLC